MTALAPADVAEKNAKWDAIEASNKYHVYGRSESIIVYLENDNAVGWESNGVAFSAPQLLAIRLFEESRLRSKQCLSSRNHERFRDSAALTLYNALVSNNLATTVEVFGTLSQRVEIEAIRTCRYLHLLWSSVAALSLLGLGIWLRVEVLNAEWHHFGAGIAAGAAGAWASVLQRVWKLELLPGETPKHISLQGATRIVLGSLFGVVALLAVKAKLLVPGAEQNDWSLMLMMFVAGFSERLIPDFLRRMDHDENGIAASHQSVLKSLEAQM